MPKNYPEEFYCPISGEVMQSPVTTITCGHTFEAVKIYDWVFLQNNDSCPCCRSKITIPGCEVYFTANEALKKQVEEYLKSSRKYSIR